LRQPALVLYQATNSLDAGAKTVILDAWRDYTKVTILVTAHRPSVLRNADQMVTVPSGRVVSAITRALERS